MTDLKLGVALWSQAATWPEMLEAARRIEAAGCDHLWTWDHLLAIYGDAAQPIFEGWSLLAGWAVATEDPETIERLSGEVKPMVDRG